MADKLDVETSTTGPSISQSEKGEDLQQEQQRTQEPPHPRSHFPKWKWTGTVVLILLASMLNGYDISNVANIQPRLYEAFGRIELLPWIGLSYSLANFCVVTLARKLAFVFDMRTIFLANLVIFMAGSAIAGAAQSMTMIIVGRIVMGVGGSIVQQTCYSYYAVLATPAEMPGLYGLTGASWAIGLVTGGPVGSAFAENAAATWRWAFYINLPFIGLTSVLALFCLPSHSMVSNVPVLDRLLKIDPLGIILNMAWGVLFTIAVTFSGAVWDWGSSPSIAAWVVFGVSFILWGVQQYFCIFTTAEDRAFPIHILSRRDLIPIWIASACAPASYAITLYYTPLFFAFARGLGPLEQTVRILPFIMLFIVFVSLTGRLLPKIGYYNIIYIVGGSMTLAAGAALASILDVDVSQSQILGLEALIGIGVGMNFQHGIAISNVINKNQRDRVDSLTLCNMAQMGSISLMLGVAGAIFHNVGHSLLIDALGDHADRYSDHEIREALSGVSSKIWQSEDPIVQRRGIEAVSEVISREFYILVAFSTLCIVCGLSMKWERLDFGSKPKEKATST
ncbi:major facilitator superfamily domain-containing protein [Dactylonectria estremocensis]|uniref:Major facilitator superfamily domain-containing protein n=1 Tax=Dactylonectria estremocensis TaxID=1079267 RepID=A0A9P9F1M0_9HYPO|nr:major facilitator superfamily domain-containing protein [Dactylonectria estremocensis]